MSEWIEWEWTEESPYPETPNAIVRVVLECDDYEDECSIGQPVKDWDWGKYDGIKSYMVVK